LGILNDAFVLWYREPMVLRQRVKRRAGCPLFGLFAQFLQYDTVSPIRRVGGCCFSQVCLAALGKLKEAFLVRLDRQIVAGAAREVPLDLEHVDNAQADKRYVVLFIR
jgi:hypothetical protein